MTLVPPPLHTNSRRNEAPAANIWPSGEKAKVVTVDIPAPQDTTLEGIAAARSQKTKPEEGRPPGMRNPNDASGGEHTIDFSENALKEMRLNVIVKESLIDKRNVQNLTTELPTKVVKTRALNTQDQFLPCETAVFTGEMFVFSVSSTMRKRIAFAVMAVTAQYSKLRSPLKNLSGSQKREKYQLSYKIAPA